MSLEKYEVIECCNLGGDYRKVTLTHPEVPVNIPPGTCAVVNGRWMAIAGAKKNRLTFVVRSGSFILRDPISQVDLPMGPGFSAGSDKHAYAVAGGIGIGAIASLVDHRTRMGSTTSVIVFHRGFDEDAVVREFPELSRTIFWNTSKEGRPENLVPAVYPGRAGSEVFVAGPQSLVDSLRASIESTSSKIYTNF